MPAVPEGRDHCPFWPTYGPPSRQFVRGRGTEIWDSAGRRYLDFLGGLAVVALGHAHPEVAEAIATQAATLLHTSNLFATVPGAEVAVTIDELLGGGGQVFLCNSGAEANEAAIKLARRWGGRGRHVVVSAYGSFHGRTLATLHATGQPAKHEAFQPLPEGFRHVAWDDLDALEAAIDPSVAAVLLEPIQGEGGVNPASTAYFQGVARLCAERGVLLMVDEVQTGPGPHRPVVRLRALRRHPRRGHPGQGPGQRRAHRGLLGPPGDRRGHGAGGPRQHLRGPAPGRGRGAGRAGRHGSARTPRAAPPGPGPGCRPRSRPCPRSSSVRGAGLLLGAELVEGLDARPVAAAALDAGPHRERGDAHHHPPGPAAAGVRRRDRRGGGHPGRAPSADTQEGEP